MGPQDMWTSGMLFGNSHWLLDRDQRHRWTTSKGHCHEADAFWPAKEGRLSRGSEVAVADKGGELLPSVFAAADTRRSHPPKSSAEVAGALAAEELRGRLVSRLACGASYHSTGQLIG